MTVFRRVAAVVSAAAVAGSVAVAVPAAPAAAACSLGISMSHTSRYVQAKLTQTCGVSYRAYGDWQHTGTHYGTYRKTPPGGTKYSVACGEPATCGTGAGSLFTGGYQDKATGRKTCVTGCGIKTMAAAAQRRAWVWQGRSLRCASCSNPTWGGFPNGIFSGSQYQRQGGCCGRNFDAGNDGTTCQGHVEGLLRLSSDNSKGLAALPADAGNPVTLEDTSSNGTEWCYNHLADGTYKIISRYWSSTRGSTQELSIQCNASDSNNFFIGKDGASGVCRRFALS